MTTTDTPAPVSALKYSRTVPFNCKGYVNSANLGTLKIEIKLGDPFGNGHEDFSITAEINHPSVRGGCLAGGCLHEEILRKVPLFAPFVALHLSDANGAPMHAMANGFYWLAGCTPEALPDATRPNEAPERCAGILAGHFRMNPEEVETLKAAGIRDASHLSAWMEAAGYRAKWKADADAAIAKLQELCGGPVFRSNATRQNWPPVSPEALEEMKAREASGFYAPEQVAERDRLKREAEKAKQIDAIQADHAKRCAESLADMQTKLFLVSLDHPTGNVIYYRHTNTLAFNYKERQWRSFEKTWTRAEFDAVVAAAARYELPAGLKFSFQD